MSHILRGIFGILAVAGSLGVAQLAVGGDLGQHARLQSDGSAVVQNVNRSGKADRGLASQGALPSQTYGVTLVGQSVLVRVPDAQVGQALRPAAQRPTAAPRRIVACEPVVSVLTEVAKNLEPGRCVT
ncbi:hypothetical protein [Rhodopseudomonas palustris]|uniref:Uncharacterized protein n=1 Tax=Rhodopseudomonas palustris TaxID=1076 RepID=A0A418VP32_RHOPL|nr:hypothetical protein [Rhodopseudomonas palustris]RJF77956.1 hypothetical protein D4Q52_03415 [Rhodopseudomonas palustris]